VDSTSPHRVKEAAMMLRSIFTMPALDETPVLIVSSKSDSPECLSAHELLAKLDLVDLVLRPPRSNRRSAVSGAAISIPDSPAGETTERTPWFAWGLSEGLRGTSGIGGRAYRCVAASGVTGDGVREGLEWLAEFLSLNARTVEAL
jgi:hypothetical protein